MAEEDISGIALGLGLDTSGFSSGVARAKAELEGLKSAARSIEIGVSTRTRQTGSTAHQVTLPGGAPAQPRISPQFQVSKGAVRDLRTDINAQMRQFSSQGEGVAVGIKLGRVPYSSLRAQISEGIGSIPIRVTIDPKSIAAAARSITSAVITGPGAPAGGIPRRATGGGVERGRPVIVGESRAETFYPTENGRIVPRAERGSRTAFGRLNAQQLDFHGNLAAAARRIQPHHMQGGLDWYTDAGNYGRVQSRKYGVDERTGLGVLAALSAGTAWNSNKTKFEKILKARAAGRPFPYGMGLDAHRKAQAILGGLDPETAFASSPKVGQFYRGLSGDLNTLTIDRWAARTATRGMIDQPGSGKQRKRMDEAYRTVAAAHGMAPAQFQAALWLLEKEESSQAPGQMGLGLEGMARGGAMRGAGFVPGLRSVAQAYNRSVGMPRIQEHILHPLDVDFSRRTAKAYEAMPVGPDALSRRAYHAFGEETEAQYEFLQKAGFRFEPDPGDPYHPTARHTKMQLAAQDVRKNKRLLAFSSALDHPLLTEEQNLKFRHVHDMMGHLTEGFSIGPRGEFNAAVKHSQMFTPLARMAMLAETHGQNSVVNFSDVRMPEHGMKTIAEINKAAPGTIYAQQKAQVLPKKILDEFYMRTGIKRAAGGPAGPLSHVPKNWQFRPQTGLSMASEGQIDDIRGEKLENLLIFNPRKQVESLIHHEIGTTTEVGRRAANLAMAGKSPFPGNIDVHNHPLQSGIEVPRPSGSDIRSLLSSGAAEARVVTPNWTTKMRRAVGSHYAPNAWNKAIRSVLDPTLRNFGYAGVNEFVDQYTEEGEGSRRANEFYDDLYSGLGDKLGFSLEREHRARGGRTSPGQQGMFFRAGRRSRPFCSVCGTSIVNPSQHLSTEKHRKALIGRTRGTGDWLKNRGSNWRNTFNEGAIDAHYEEEARQHEWPTLEPEWWPSHMAGGGRSGRAMYIVNELGKEKFVPKSRERDIPPDVASRLPGGHQLVSQYWGRSRHMHEEALDAFRSKTAAIEEIPGHGARLWQAPGDGWIVPAHLASKLPHAAEGRRVGGAGGGSESQAAYEARLNAERERQARHDEVLRERDRQVAAIAAQRTQRGRLAALSRTAEAHYGAAFDLPDTGTGGRSSADPALAEIRINNSIIRGLTGRSALGGAVAGLTGGRGRRVAALEAQTIGAELRGYAPKGVSPVEFRTGEFHDAETALNELGKAGEGLRKTFKPGSKELQEYGVAITKQTAAVAKSRETLEHVQSLELRRQDALARASGGAVQNFAAVTAAGFAFNVGMQAVGAGMDLATKAAAPVVDQLTGYAAANQRVTGDLAKNLPAAGTLSTLFGQTGVSAGLSLGNTQFLQQQLGGSVLAKAGATKAGQAGDLFRAAMGGQAPSGLIGGFGGIGGGGLFAQQLGGGTGLLETIASSAAAARGRPESPGVFGLIGEGLGAAGRAGSNLAGMLLPGTVAERVQRGNQGRANSPLNPVIGVPAGLQQQTLDYANEAISRARTSQGLGAGARLTDVGRGSAEAQGVLQIPGLDDYTKQLAEAGVVFKDAAGSVVTSEQDIQKATADIATGLAIPDAATYAKTQAQQLSASEQATGVRGQFERGTAIPGQLGQQVYAQPFGQVAAGLEKGFKPVIADLGETAKLQKTIQQQADVGIQKQATFIGQNVGAPEQAQFTQDMGAVQGYGKQIAAINDQLSNRQAAIGALQFANSIRIISRNIRDARGLAGMSGGSRLGGIERQQYELGRQSQQLGFQSTGLSLALNQRQINFQTATAGFQAPGMTAEERTANIQAAKLEAEYAQKQQDIAVQQLGIGKRQYGLEGQAFGIQTGQSVQDLQAQRAILEQSHSLEQEQIAAQKRINALTILQGQKQAEAQSLFAQATNNFDGRLAAAAQYAGLFGGTMAGAIKAVTAALDAIPGASHTGTNSRGVVLPGDTGSESHGTRGATGLAAMTRGQTTFVAGEIKDEAVFIVKNPKVATAPAMAPAAQAAPSQTIQIIVTGNTIKDEGTIDDLVRKVEAAIMRRGAAMGLRPTG